MFGGERLDAALVAGLSPRLEGVHLLNHYGPTEATVGCAAYRFEADQVTGEGALPIGQPVWNSRAYVVDADLRPVAPGEEGELVLAGLCVADGYLGGADEDRARFVEESAMAAVERTGPEARADRTGDRCAVRDGALHYRGRLDEQVKVRGYRIEIQEVHDLAVAVDGVAQAAVSVSQVGLGGLELFVVAEGDEDPVARVLEHLRANLPAAAVPSKVFVVPHLVANAHGKWDAEATPPRWSARRATRMGGMGKRR